MSDDARPNIRKLIEDGCYEVDSHGHSLVPMKAGGVAVIFSTNAPLFEGRGTTSDACIVGVPFPHGYVPGMRAQPEALRAWNEEGECADSSGLFQLLPPKPETVIIWATPRESGGDYLTTDIPKVANAWKGEGREVIELTGSRRPRKRKSPSSDGSVPHAHVDGRKTPPVWQFEGKPFRMRFVYHGDKASERAMLLAARGGMTTIMAEIADIKTLERAGLAVEVKG